MINKIIDKIKRNRKRKANPASRYIEYIETLPIDEFGVLAEGSRGSNVDGNTFYCVCEILRNPQYSKYNVHVVVADEKLQKSAIKKYGELAHRINFVIHHTREYYQRVATCKYLINDATFAPFFIKRRGQVFLDTWHGTPLKSMGRKNITEFDVLGNVQHNLSMADYVLAPNRLTERVMTEDYMLNDISKAKQLYCGYPRNIAFDESKVDDSKKKLGLTDKSVYAYLPTWRGKSSKASGDANRELELHLGEIDKLLNDNEIMLTRLHHLSRTEIDFSSFSHIVDFPDDLEMYEALNATDALVTDYSSVLFDYAVSRRPVILYTYDKKEYEGDRGFNVELASLPFEQVETAEELVKALRKKPNRTKEYDAFVEEFCPWDDNNSAKNVVSQLILGSCERKVIPTEANGRLNVLLYAGDFESEGTLHRIKRFLLKSNTTEANYYISFYTITNPERVNALRGLLTEYPHLRYIEFRGKRNMSRKKGKEDLYEYQRLLEHTNFDKYILLDETDRRIIPMLKAGKVQFEVIGEKNAR